MASEKEENKDKQKGKGKSFWLQEKLSDYSSSFTIHGLSRTIHTDSHFERFFWIASLLLALSIAFFLVRTLMSKYWDKEVYWSSEMKGTTQNTFPAVTFCLEKIKQSNLYCKMQADSELHGKIVPTSPACNNIKWWEMPVFFFFPRKLIQISLVGQTSLSTLPPTFGIHCPSKGDCINKDISGKYFQPTPEDSRCLTWNWNGNFSNIKNRVQLDLSVSHRGYRDKSVVAYVHDHRESPLTKEHSIPISTTFNTDIILKKSIKKRKQRSPPNNCEDTYYNNTKNIFPGRYTMESCQDTYTCIESLKLCGDVLDFCKDHLPHELLEQYWNPNVTLLEVHRCLLINFDKGSFFAPTDYCFPPCEETHYTAQTSVSVPGSMIISLIYSERNVYELQEEKLVYTWEDFLAGTGGMIGLFCGFSILSLAELTVYLCLRLVTFCVKKHNFHKEDSTKNGKSLKNEDSHVIDIIELDKKIASKSNVDEVLAYRNYVCG
ncbi:acid-sensing ion channel 5-like [Clytia hemisphaerica]|uniref:acid-sensing ion channel 5-like n=1 Tax=Clytia hemisphaerica TaxID=252671 RepID=UPI0034D4534A